MRVGILDAGVVLTRLSPRRKGHAHVVKLMGGAGRTTRLILSTVNLAEVLEHVRGLAEAAGFDAVGTLRHLGVEIEAPDVDVARGAAQLAGIDDLSLADRFALATARVRGGRLYTTDGVLADAARAAKVAVTRI